MQRVFLLVCLVVCAHLLPAQNTIRGVVVDENNQPIIGASVMVDEASNAIVTDFDGSFEISVVEGTKLSIAMLGYRPVEQAAAQDMVVVLRKKVAFKAKLNAIPREHFVLANYSYAFNNTHNIGVTYGWCHAVGFYANFMLGLNGFHYSPEGKIEFRGDYGNSGYLGSQLTNEHTHQRISVTPGILVRLGCPLYFNFGCGVAYHTVTHKATNGDWVDCQWLGSRQAAINFQIGLLGNFKGFSLMANYSSFGFRHSEILIGIGFALEGKKGGKNEN